MAPHIREMLVCEACGYIADRECVLTEIGKGVKLKLREYKCGKCDSLSERLSNQKKDSTLTNEGEQSDNGNINDKVKECSKSESCQDLTNETKDKPDMVPNKNRGKQKLNVMCQQCSFNTSSTTLLMRHEKSDHCEDGGVSKIPDPRVDSIQVCVEDENKVEGQANKSEVLKSIQCTKCNFSTTRTEYLNRHIRLMHNKEQRFKCQDCKFKSNRSDRFKNHVKAVHEKVRHRKCPHCDHETFDTCSLKNHIKAKHLKIRDYQCEICDKTFTRSSYLKSHIKLVHAMVKDFQCPSCEYSTGWRPNLKIHIKTQHDKVKDMKCPHCNYTTGQPSALRGHKKNVHSSMKHLQCPSCDYKTKRPPSLKVHIKSVHARQRDHKCPKCEYKSAQLGNLKTHMRVVHDKIKDFKCPYCNYVSAAAQSVENHISSKHLQMSDSICKFCDKAFSSSQYLISHMKRVHDKDPNDLVENSDGLTIYIKPNISKINDTQVDNLLNEHLETTDKEHPPSSNLESDDNEQAESILGV